MSGVMGAAAARGEGARGAYDWYMKDSGWGNWAWGCGVGDGLRLVRDWEGT